MHFNAFAHETQIVPSMKRESAGSPEGAKAFSRMKRKLFRP